MPQVGHDLRSYLFSVCGSGEEVIAKRSGIELLTRKRVDRDGL